MDFSFAATLISEKTGIKINERDVERIFSAVATTSDPWRITDYSDLPVPAVFAALKFLNEESLVRFTNTECLLTDKGRAIADELQTVKDMTCEVCEGRGLSLRDFAELRSVFEELQRRRPAPSHDYDQGYVTPSTTVARFVFAHEKGDIEGRDVLVLGDDDLLSIVLGLSRLPKSISVVEIDDRLTDFIRETGEKHNFSVEVVDLDLRLPLPDRYVGTYDTFFTDPPETISAADAFVGRGIASLRKPGSAGYFGFTRREASLGKWFELQRLLLGYGVVITDIIHNFSEYVNWGYEKETKAWQISPVKVLPGGIWYRSALYRIQALHGYTGCTKDYGTQNIYEDQESSTT